MVERTLNELRFARQVGQCPRDRKDGKFAEVEWALRCWRATYIVPPPTAWWRDPRALICRGRILLGLAVARPARVE